MSEIFRLFVGGIPENISSAELSSRFQRFGEVIEIQLAPPLSDSTTQPDPTVTNRGFGHLTLRCVDKASAKQAIKTYHNCKWRGKVMRVEIANGGLVSQTATPAVQPGSETVPLNQTSETAKPVESKPEVTQLKLRTQSGKMKVDVAAAKTTKFDDDESTDSAVPIVDPVKSSNLTETTKTQSKTEPATITPSEDVASLFAEIPTSTSTFASNLFANAAKQKQESQLEDKEIVAEENREKKEQRRVERQAKFGTASTQIEKPVEPVAIPSQSVPEKPQTVEKVVVSEQFLADKEELPVETEPVKPVKVAKRQGPFDMKTDLQLKEDLKAETQMALSWLSSLVGDETDDTPQSDGKLDDVVMDFEDSIETSSVPTKTIKSEKKRNIRDVSTESQSASTSSNASKPAEISKSAAVSVTAVSEATQSKKSKFKAPPPTAKTIDMSESFVEESKSVVHDVAATKTQVKTSTVTAATSESNDSVVEPLKKKSKFKAPPASLSTADKSTESSRFCAMTSSWSSVFSAPDAASAPSNTSSAEPFKFGSLFAAPTSQSAFKLSSLLPTVTEASTSDETPSLFQSKSKTAIATDQEAIEKTKSTATSKVVNVTDVTLPADSLFSLNASLQPVCTLPLVNRFTRDPTVSVDALQSKFRYVKSELSRDYKFKHKLAKKRNAKNNKPSARRG